VTLELGGKSPLIVAADADVAKAVDAVHFGLFFNAGQVCCAASRVYVHKSIAAEFLAASKAKAAARTLGDGFSGAAQGPQVDAASVEKIERMVAEGLAAGAELVCGGKRVPGPGFFFEPTIVTANDENILAREEVFGPVLTVLTFDDIEEVIARANASSYGLAAAVYTRSLDTATHVSMALRAGVVWVNCYDVLEASVPFGGFKQSGTGRELGQAGLAQYSEIKTITIALGSAKNVRRWPFDASALRGGALHAPPPRPAQS